MNQLALKIVQFLGLSVLVAVGMQAYASDPGVAQNQKISKSMSIMGDDPAYQKRLDEALKKAKKQEQARQALINANKNKKQDKKVVLNLPTSLTENNPQNASPLFMFQNATEYEGQQGKSKSALPLEQRQQQIEAIRQAVKKEVK